MTRIAGRRVKPYPEVVMVHRFNSTTMHFQCIVVEYVRVLEIPTPRYSLLDAIAMGIDVKETGHPGTIQERVYSSPIWYNP